VGRMKLWIMVPQPEADRVRSSARFRDELRFE
jgi:hypothetical protein